MRGQKHWLPRRNQPPLRPTSRQERSDVSHLQSRRNDSEDATICRKMDAVCSRSNTGSRTGSLYTCSFRFGDIFMWSRKVCNVSMTLGAILRLTVVNGKEFSRIN